MADDNGDHYEILRVPRDANSEEIRSAYRERARESHPDRNTSPDAVDRMQKINEAYEILGDATRRAEYDRAWSNRGRSSRFEGYQSARSGREQTAYTPPAPVARQPSPGLTVVGLELLAMLYGGLIVVNVNSLEGLCAGATAAILVLGAIAFPIMWRLGKRRASIIGAVSAILLFLIVYPLFVGAGLERWLEQEWQQFVCGPLADLFDETC